MTLPGTLLLALLVASPLAVAEIYKCRDSKGNDKYQNFPCQIDSIGSKATAAPPKEDPAVSTALQPATTPAVLRPNPVPGMRMVEVRDAWGAPKKTAVNRGVESWFYAGPDGNTREVRFDRDGTVVVVNERAELPPNVDDEE
jgi:hypothetical protein